jgi:hypothetical protein
MGIDLDRFRIPPEMIGDRSALDLPRHGPRETFLRGPIPYRWLAEAARLPGSGFAVAMGVWYLARRFRREARMSIPELAGLLGLGRTTTKTALQAAEGAGLISVHRAPGRKLSLSPREIPGAGRGPKPLRGPIPWGWWMAAVRLPGRATQVAAACWLVAGWEKSAEIELVLGGWGELGLSRFSAGRGLHTLENAGLVTVVRRAGGPPTVTLLDGPRPGARS